MSDTLGLYKLDTIVTGDARKLSKAIPDASIDLIFTDPVYDRIDDYRWLAETAARVLKPNSACLVWCGIQWLGQTISAMNEAMEYRWTFGAVRPKGFPSGRFFQKGFSNWQCCLWYQKGISSPVLTISDITFSDNGGLMMYHADWAKNVAPFIHWLGRFVNDGAIVFDPFTGGGTVPAVCKMLGRRYLAFEIDATVAERARERVRNTQPPLFVDMPQQLALPDD